MELFPRETREPPKPPEDAPLAERQRPRDLADFEGQAHLLGTDGPLGPVVRGAGTLQSLILWGPPGCGKTMLAACIAGEAAVAPLDGEAVARLRREMERGRLSARGYHRVRRVARTIADLAREPTAPAEAMAEALSYRAPALGGLNAPMDDHV